MRALITGGAGFIGSHLSDELLGRGDLVHVLDDLSTGAMDNIRHLKERSGFEYTIETAANVPLVAELVDSADVVYHLAAAVGVQLIVESPVRTIETNVHCTEVVLEQASKKKKPVFIASTSEVYGKSRDIPYHEDGDLTLGATLRGRWSYACSRRSTSSWQSRTGKSASFQPSSDASSTRLVHARPAATEWSSLASSARRWPDSRSPSTATAPSSAASAT
jgi:nucleoside-diphosphate-sugar epimerase